MIKNQVSHETWFLSYRNDDTAIDAIRNSKYTIVVPIKIPELAVRRIAENEGMTHGFDSKDFRLEISKSRTSYSVACMPKARIRGDGLRIGIGKRDLKVKEVVHLQ